MLPIPLPDFNLLLTSPVTVYWLDFGFLDRKFFIWVHNKLTPFASVWIAASVPEAGHHTTQGGMTPCLRRSELARNSRRTQKTKKSNPKTISMQNWWVKSQDFPTIIWYYTTLIQIKDHQEICLLIYMDLVSKSALSSDSGGVDQDLSLMWKNWPCKAN